MINSHVPKEVKQAEGYYESFVEKFKPKRTTDDCCTPENIYQAVRDFVVSAYGLHGARVIRPFWPGADYQAVEYPKDCVVIDNPPFSILSQICKWYMARGIRFFLFAPTLTLFNIANGAANYVVSGGDITYENGAKVRTSFVTNLGAFKIWCAPQLQEKISACERENGKAAGKELPAYEYPDHVATVARLARLSKNGVEFRIPASEAYFIRTLDEQRQFKKEIFGCGFLIPDRAAVEKAAAEKAVAEKAKKRSVRVWALSDREKEIIRGLG